MRRLAGTGSNDGSAVWSADSRWLYFVSDHAGAKHLWKMAPNGRDPVPVNPTEGGRLRPMADSRNLILLRRSGNSVSMQNFISGEPWFDVAFNTDLDNGVLEPVSDGAYFLEAADGRFNVVFVHADSRKRSVLADVSGRYSFGISVAPDRSHLVFTRVQSGQVTVALLKNWR